MKMYLISIGLLFLGMALLIVTLPSNLLDSDVIRGIVPGLYPHAAFAIMWTGAAALCMSAGIWYVPALRLVGQSLGIGVTIAWTMLLAFEAVEDRNIGSWTRILPWLFIIAVQAGSVRYYAVPPKLEAEAQRLFTKLLEDHKQSREGGNDD